MDGIHTLELEDRPRILAYLRRDPPTVSELSFASLFAWRRSYPVWWLERRDTLVLGVDRTAAAAGRWIVGMPFGAPIPPAEWQALVPDLRGYIRVPEESTGELQRAGLRIFRDDDNADYVYRTADLADLPGDKYHKKKNLVTQCLAACECRYEPLTPALIPECLAMQAAWCGQRQCDLVAELCREYDAIRETMAHFEALGVFGGVVRVRDRIQAYAIGEELSPSVAVCHFEKAMPEWKGLAQLMNQWFAVHALGAYPFVNREQDLGIQGLRQAKASYHPHHRVWKYRAVFGADEGSSDGADALAGPLPARECDQREAAHTEVARE